MRTIPVPDWVKEAVDIWTWEQASTQVHCCGLSILRKQNLGTPLLRPG
jgi:hypothetical protein